MKNVICALSIVLAPLLEAMIQELRLSVEQNSYVVVGMSLELHKAVRNGDIELIQRLLDRGANINARNSEYETPLHVAAGNGKNAIVKFLLTKKGIDVNAQARDGRTPLGFAFDNRCMSTAEILENFLEMQLGLKIIPLTEDERELIKLSYFKST